MKHISYNILPLLMLCFFSSCIVEDGPSDSLEGQLVHKVFTATFEDSDMTTKTMLDGNVGEDGIRGLLWDPGDEIGVAQYNYDYQCFRNTIPYASSNGVFEGSVGQGQFYYAVYPYQGAMVHRTNINVTIPTVQTYRENSFDRNVAPMVGQGKDGEPLHFMNICGVLAVQLTGSGIVKSIVFETKNGEKVSGVCSVDTDYVEYPLLDATAATETYVILDCGEGVQLSSEATPFHIVLPPGTYNGFTLYITTVDGKFMKQETSKTLAIKRSIVTKAASFDFENNMTDLTDLSEHGYSNCYIVSEAGFYSFDADIIGNGESGVIEGAEFHTDNPSICPANVEILWQDREGIIEPATLSLGATNKVVTFMTTGRKGNAVIAVRDDAENIIWSWHIWATDQPEEEIYVNRTGSYPMLDRNLGAVAAFSEQTNDVFGLLYQWGRKDPFRADYFHSERSRTSIANSIANPGVIYQPSEYDSDQNWQQDYNTMLWTKAQKTIYDPCPVGYKVPHTDVWLTFYEDDEAKFSGELLYGLGIYLIYDGTATTFYPVGTSIRHGQAWGNHGNWSEQWSSEASGSSYASQFEYYYHSQDDFRLYSATDGMSNAHHIRCMKDE